MEHIIQFGVSIDDKTIEEKVLKAATDEVLKLVKDTAGSNSSWNSNHYVRNTAKLIIRWNIASLHLQSIGNDVENSRFP